MRWLEVRHPRVRNLHHPQNRMKKAGTLVALATFASVFLAGLGFWSLTKIEGDVFDADLDDDGCCNSGFSDCIC